MDTTLTFWNGTDTATGSEFLLQRNGHSILIDCGLVQGGGFDHERNSEQFQHNVRDIDALIVTHAHMDHIGRIPKLVREGFEGTIYSTEPTKRLAEVMFQDALKVMDILEHEENIAPLYTSQDVVHALEQWETRTLHTPFQPSKGAGLTATFKDAGHILGSSMVELRAGDRAILFTGDLGNTPHDLLPDTEEPGSVQYIVSESVYGDRNHEGREERLQQFADIINDTIHHNGTLLIPVFSLERSQDILFDLNRLVEEGVVPKVPVFLDSPLAIDITHVYQQFPEWFNASAQQLIAKGDDIFEFPGLIESYTVSESKEINGVSGPKIILAGSGMSHGGRIQHHELQHLSDPKNCILFVGYQMPGSLGRRIIDGAPSVVINKKKVKVRAHAETLFSYSAHKDSDHIQEFIGSAEGLETAFLVLGEQKSRLFLAQRLHDYYGITTKLPERGEVVTLNL